jgi:hypothetical protein
MGIITHLLNKENRNTHGFSSMTLMFPLSTSMHCQKKPSEVKGIESETKTEMLTCSFMIEKSSSDLNKKSSKKLSITLCQSIMSKNILDAHRPKTKTIGLKKLCFQKTWKSFV